MAEPEPLFCALASLLLSVAASAEERNSGMAECTTAAQTATAAAQLRDSGKPKSEVESTLLQRELAQNTPTGRMMYAALDDVYEFSDVGVFSHYYYRMYTCVLQQGSEPGPSSFKVVHGGVVACESQHGASASGALGVCLMKVIDASSRAGL